MLGPAQTPGKIITSLCFTRVQLGAKWCGAWHCQEAEVVQSGLCFNKLPLTQCELRG